MFNYVYIHVIFSKITAVIWIKRYLFTLVIPNYRFVKRKGNIASSLCLVNLTLHPNLVSRGI